MQKRRSRTEWQKIIEEFEQAGLTPEVFAAGRGVNANTLRWWRSRFRRAAREEPAETVTFLPVAVEGWPAAGGVAPSSVDVALANGVQLRFEYALDAGGLCDLANAFGAVQ